MTRALGWRSWRVVAVRFGIALFLAAAALAPWLLPVRAQSPAATGAEAYFLPAIYVSDLPSGVFVCNEYEAGVIWATEVITLLRNGESAYAYPPPYAGVVTGTWVYTPQTQELGFTEFRWQTATLVLPDRIWARQWLPGPEFEIGLECQLQGAP